MRPRRHQGPWSPYDEAVPHTTGFAGTGAGDVDRWVRATLAELASASRPEVLLLVPTADGGQVLAGTEWIVVDDDQDLSTDADRPSVYGHPFDGPMPGHGPGMPVHYDLHAWAWVDNRAGGFATFNSDIVCPPHEELRSR